VIPLIILKCHQEPIQKKGHITDEATLLSEVGIFNRWARSRPEMWRTLGYIPAIWKENSRGKHQFMESGHVDSANPTSQLLGPEGNPNLSSGVPAQDFHTTLSKILEEFIAIQEEGFEWDLVYRGKEYKGVEFIPYVHFIKCDTEEADRLAGKYTSRGINVSQICRYCCCPTTVIEDWISMLETLLMWESWLKSDTISHNHVHRAQKKHRFIRMYSIGRYKRDITKYKMMKVVNSELTSI
jgi:hypothetical protein